MNSFTNFMKILYLTQHFGTFQSISGARHWWVTERLSEEGHQVTVLTGPGSLPVEVQKSNPRSVVDVGAKSEIRIIPAKYSQKMGFFQRFISFSRYMLGSIFHVLTCRRPDLIIATSTPLSVVVPALVGWWFRRIPFVFEVRDRWPAGPIALGKVKNPLLKFFMRRVEASAYKHAQKIIALSPGMKDGIVADGVPDDKVTVITNMADIDSFRPDVDGSQIRKQYEIEDKFVVGYSGTMGFVNGCNTIIDAAVECQSRDDIVFVMLGDGNEKPGMQQRIERENIKNVIFLDSVQRSRVPGIVATMDIALMTIRYFKIKEENSANKFFDYLASGTPVVLNYGGWQAEWLKKYNAGTNVIPDDGKNLARIIMELSRQPELLVEMGRNARKLAEDEFSFKKLLDRYSATIAEVMETIPSKKRR